MSVCSGFNNPNAYCACPSVNTDLPFKSPASMFIKKSDDQWRSMSMTLLWSFHFCSGPDVLQGCKTAGVQWWENNLLEKSVYSKDVSVELGDGKRTVRNKSFGPLSREILFSWATRRQRLGQGWNSEIFFSLREGKQEKNNVSPAIANVALGPTFGSVMPSGFPSQL